MCNIILKTYKIKTLKTVYTITVQNLPSPWKQKNFKEHFCLHLVVLEKFTNFRTKLLSFQKLSKKRDGV